jgi:fructose-specific phosphotransferase system component IIB
MGLFTDILKGLPENAVLRSKVAKAEERYGALETENAILKDDLRDAKAVIAELKQQVKDSRIKMTSIVKHYTF